MTGVAASTAKERGGSAVLIVCDVRTLKDQEENS